MYKGNVTLPTIEDSYKCSTPVAIKLINLNLNFSDRCVLHDLYNEIAVMERL